MGSHNVRTHWTHHVCILTTGLELVLLLLLLLLHGSTVLVGPWPPSRQSSSRLFCAHVSSSLWHPSSSGPPSLRPSTLILVFLHSYFLLECSDITPLPPFPHLSSPHVPAISIFLFLFLLLCPILHIITSHLPGVGSLEPKHVANYVLMTKYMCCVLLNKLPYHCVLV